MSCTTVSAWNFRSSSSVRHLSVALHSEMSPGCSGVTLPTQSHRSNDCWPVLAEIPLYFVGIGVRLGCKQWLQTGVYRLLTKVQDAQNLRRSYAPHILSSVAPSGSSTRGVGLVIEGSFSPFLKRARASGPIMSGLVGLELKGSCSTTSMSGSTAVSDRTCMLLILEAQMVRAQLLESTHAMTPIPR